MQRVLSHRRALSFALALSALLLGLIPLPAAKAQSTTIGATPTTLYRWRVSNTNGGYMLHPFISAGQNLGYTNEGSVFKLLFPSTQVAGIVLPQGPGVTPAPGNPLIPIYQWRVVQSGRTYYYYSGAGFQGGPGYYFEGQLGWVLPPNFQATTINGNPIQGVPINYYYSQRYGYWYTNLRPDIPGPVTNCFPDSCSAANTSYRFQGVGFQLPTWDPQPACILPFCLPPVFAFNPPPPPPVCDGDQEQACYDSGGSWDSANCRCTIIREPEPCFDCPLPMSQ
jgi:hypothetical protein